MNQIKKFFYIRKLMKESDNLINKMEEVCVKYSTCDNCTFYKKGNKSDCLVLNRIEEIEKEVCELS